MEVNGFMTKLRSPGAAFGKAATNVGTSARIMLKAQMPIILISIF